MTILTGQTISRELLDALGVPKHCVSFQLNVHARKIVTMRCEYEVHADEFDQEAVANIFKEHAFVKKPPAGFEYTLVPIGAPALLASVLLNANADIWAKGPRV